MTFSAVMKCQLHLALSQGTSRPENLPAEKPPGGVTTTASGSATEHRRLQRQKLLFVSQWKKSRGKNSHDKL